jgi:D-citramalate synthase
MCTRRLEQRHAKLPDYVFQFLDFSTQPVKEYYDTWCPYSQTFAFISEITSKYPNIHFDFHAHNDYDLSIANVISYKSRYKGLHVTVNGMGNEETHRLKVPLR